VVISIGEAFVVVGVGSYQASPQARATLEREFELVTAILQ
jgi:hypothetical protein